MSTFRSLTTGGAELVDANTVITKPAGVQAGDLLIAIHQVHNTSHTWSSVPSGWNLLLDRVGTGIQPWEQSIFWKIAGASEPANYNFVVNAHVARRYQMLAYSGVHQTTPLSALSALFTEGGGGNAAYTSMSAPSITPPANGKRLLCCWLLDDSWDVVTATPPGSMTQRYWQYFNTGGAMRGTLIADEAVAGGAATGTRTATQGFGNAYESWSVSINDPPAAARARVMVV